MSLSEDGTNGCSGLVITTQILSSGQRRLTVTAEVLLRSERNFSLLEKRELSKKVRISDGPDVQRNIEASKERNLRWTIKGTAEVHRKETTGREN